MSRYRLTGRIKRDNRAGWLGGVCAGIGEAMTLDPVLIRIVAVISLFLMPGITIGAYLAAWVLMPEARRRC